MAQVFVKDPSAVLDYKIDWSSWLDTDTIASSVWETPTGITNVTDTNTTTTTTIWLSGGTIKQDYEIVNTITTAGGRTDQRTIRIEVRER